MIIKIKNMASPNPIPASQTLFQNARILHEHQQYEGAERLYRKLLKITPKNPEVLHCLGVLYAQQNCPDDAIKYIKKAQNLQPKNLEYTLNLARLYVETKASKAIKILEGALITHPHNSDAIRLLAAAYERNNDINRAYGLLQEELEALPDSAEILNDLGNMTRLYFQDNKAIDLYNKAIQVNPEFPQPYANLSGYYIHKGEYGLGLKVAQQGLQVVGDIAELYNNLGLCHEGLLYFEEAMEAYEKAFKINSLWTVPAQNLSRLYYRMGRHKETTMLLTHVTQINPKNAQAWFFLAQSLLTQGQYDTALNAAVNAGDIEPHNGLYWQAIGYLLSRINYSDMTELHKEYLIKAIVNPAVLSPEIIERAVQILDKQHSFRNIDSELSDLEPSYEYDFAFSNILKPLLEDPLTIALLRKCPIPYMQVESVLAKIRRMFLSAYLDDTYYLTAPHLFKALCALNKQCYLTEHVYFCSEKEELYIQEILADPPAISKDPLFYAIIGCYQSLDGLNNREALAQWANKNPSSPLADCIKLQVINTQIESELEQQIPQLTPINPGVSQQVQKMYETYPFPRWNDLASQIPARLPERVAGLFPYRPDIINDLPRTPSLLIAGTGTGQHALFTAAISIDSPILAIDLSRRSLAYAMRKAQEYNYQGIQFAQADIENITALKQQFDVIESIGVLHHMQDPLRGWRKLVDILKPGGLMHIGLYSQVARQSIHKAREMIAAENLKPTVTNIRDFRQTIAFYQGEDSEIREIMKFRDFYTVSGCNDLLFHVQEHCYTLPQIKSMVEKLGLQFLGMNYGPEGAEGSNMFNHDFDYWINAEEKNPDMFKGMYIFWCYKPKEK